MSNTWHSLTVHELTTFTNVPQSNPVNDFKRSALCFPRSMFSVWVYQTDDRDHLSPHSWHQQCRNRVLTLAAAAASFSLQCAKLPMASSWECNLHSPGLRLSAFQIKGHALQLLSCFTISLAALGVSILLSFINKTIDHVDPKLAMIKHCHNHTVAMLWLK